MGLDVNRLLESYLAESVRLSPKGSEGNPEHRDAVFLSEQQHQTLYVLIDSEGMLYKMPFNNASRSYTFQNVVEEVANLVNRYLFRPPGTQHYEELVVDLRCDLRTPANKALTRKKGKNTPSTPRYKSGDELMAWYNEFSFKHSRSASQGEFDSKRAMNFVLPATSGQLKSRGVKPENAVTLQDYLRNPHFKRFLNRVVYENVINFVRFPEGELGDKSCVLIRGPEISFMKTPKLQGAIPPHLNFSYSEADTAIGVISARCRHPLYPERHCDLLVNSTASDGDCFLVLAAARNRCLKPAPLNAQTGWRAPESVDDLQFSNSVTLMRSGVYYDMNEFYRCAVELNRRKASPASVQLNPVLAMFVPIMLPGDSFDYVSHEVLQNVGDGSFLSAYYDCIDCLDTLVSSHTQRPDQVLVNADQLGRLIIAAHGDRYKTVKLDMEKDYEYNFALLREKVPGKRIPTRNQVRVFAAQLSWALTYFTASSYERAAPDPFECSPAGFSLWGYEKRSSSEEDGRFEVAAPEDVDLEYLYERYRLENERRDKSSKADAIAGRQLRDAAAAQHGL